VKENGFERALSGETREDSTPESSAICLPSRFARAEARSTGDYETVGKEKVLASSRTLCSATVLRDGYRPIPT